MTLQVKKYQAHVPVVPVFNLIKINNEIEKRNKEIETNNNDFYEQKKNAHKELTIYQQMNNTKIDYMLFYEQYNRDSWTNYSLWCELEPTERVWWCNFINDICDRFNYI